MFVIDHAYYGNTSTLIDISPYKYEWPGGQGPGPHTTHQVTMPDIFRGLFRAKDAGLKYAVEVKGKIKEVLAQGKKLLVL